MSTNEWTAGPHNVAKTSTIIIGNIFFTFFLIVWTNVALDTIDFQKKFKHCSKHF